MANKYAGTQTEKNLEAAFAGESMARNKYTYYASKAKKEGYEQIAALHSTGYWVYVVWVVNTSTSGRTEILYYVALFF